MEAKHRETKEDVEEAIRLLRQSLAIDPNLARAWTRLFWAYQSIVGYVDATPALWQLRDEADAIAVDGFGVDREVERADHDLFRIRLGEIGVGVAGVATAEHARSRNTPSGGGTAFPCAR